MMQTELKVKGMTCGHCKSAVEGALAEATGVSNADVDLDEGVVSIDYDESTITLDQIKEVIEDQGYDVK
ncbi:MAG TPA: copper chaperone CopZ [Pseudogracilibacillus sp.]|nr:copper chaperone CopZ [Pseudogracilibacillus sp.]